MMSSLDDKTRSNRGQKRNFSFESHPLVANENPQSVDNEDNGAFDLAALVNDIEKNFVGSEKAMSSEVASLEKVDDDLNKNDDNNNMERSVGGESLLSRASYIPFPTANPEDLKYAAPVDLQVSNLDQTIDQREMKKILFSLFGEYVNVLNVSVFFQSDGNMAASVRVGSPQEAQVAISQLHKKKLGYKSILISNNHVNNFNPNMLRSKVGALLAEVPNGRLQLFKFREMYEKRYHESIGVSDLYKMKDVVNITEDGDVSGRMIQLQPNWFTISCQQMQQQRLNNLQMDFMPTSTVQSAISRPINGNSAASFFPLQQSLHNLVPSQCPQLLDSAFCQIHCSETGDSKVGWAEKENGTLLPNVNISLAVLGPNVKQLIQSHAGTLPLASLAACYSAIFPPGLQIDNDEGVPLEHLVTCIRGIIIQQSASGTKQLIHVGVPQPHQGIIGTTITGRNKEGKISSVFSHFRQLSGSSITSSASSTASSSMTNLTTFGLSTQVCPQSTVTPLAGQLALFSRELVDLLKTSSGCRMLFNKFIPAYHHHFGRQCRVADYGYTKLKELFEALPHVVQIMGEGSRALITLAHRAQVKRFTNDLLRVLKSQPSKQISILDLPLCFEKSINKPFKISDYGVCDLEDILLEVSETTVVLSGSGDDMMISIPKREQTETEVKRTHQFAQECIELLRHAPDCRLNFNKFIPAYHHHFGRQCRVSDYGFSKLIELFEAIPMTVEITEDADGERILQLTDSERLAVLGDQITSLIVQNSSSMMNNNSKLSDKQSIKLEDLEEAYKNQFGYQLRPDTYGDNSVVALLGKLNQSLRVDNDELGVPHVRLIDRSYIKALANQVREILADEPEGKMKVEKFVMIFEEKNGIIPDLVQLKNDLFDWVEVFQADPKEPEDLKPMPKVVVGNSGDSHDVDRDKNENVVVATEDYIKLKPLQLCVVKIKNLLKDYGDRILMSEFEAAFADRYSSALCPGQYGFPSLVALIQSPLMAEEHILIRGRGARKMIWYFRNGVVPNFTFPSAPTQQPTGRAIVKTQNADNFSFLERTTTAINNLTTQYRYPGSRSETLRFNQTSGTSARNWTGPGAVGRSGSVSNQFQRAIRGPQLQVPTNPSRFVYPPPIQSPFSYNFGNLQSVATPQGDLGSSYWGNLAQFGLFPNGRGGVAPVGLGMGSQVASGEDHGYQNQNLAVGSGCGRSIRGSLVPPPPLQQMPIVGSPLHNGISSLLPTPHSPSPMMSGPGTSPFMFPPTYWSNNGNSPGPFAAFK